LNLTISAIVRIEPAPVMRPKSDDPVPAPAPHTIPAAVPLPDPEPDEL